MWVRTAGDAGTFLHDGQTGLELLNSSFTNVTRLGDLALPVPIGRLAWSRRTGHLDDPSIVLPLLTDRFRNDHGSLRTLSLWILQSAGLIEHNPHRGFLVLPFLDNFLE